MSAAQSSDSEAAPVPPPSDLAAYSARLQSAIIPPTRIAGSLPLGGSLAYQRTLDRAAGKELDAVSDRVLGLIDKLVRYAGGKGKGKALTADDLLEGRDYRAVVGDVLDQLLENADVCLDEFAGRNKAPAIDIKAPAPKPSQPRRLSQALLHATHLPKPQLKFRTPPDNTPLSAPYIPTPHPNPGPYESAPPSSLLTSSTPASISSFESTPFTYVDTPEQLKAMVASLKNSTEIALDLEHNSMRTYKGLVCLIQLSSRTQDWVIDALALREEMVVLRGVLEDPKIVKVLHGAESDVIWLQRDFGLFIVGLFDTFHASKVLGFPKHSLAALLARYTDFTPDKQYQLADWRIRPLPEEMLHYARADTHFLLHIYDQLRNALLEHSINHPPLPPTPLSGTPPPDTISTLTHTSNVAPMSVPASPGVESAYPWAITRVLARSATTAGKPYAPEIPDPAGLAKRWDLQLGNGSGARSRSGSPTDGSSVQKLVRPVEQKAAVFEAAFWWRDRVARQEDESPVYVLANTALFQIAMNAPTTLAALHKAVPRLSAPARQHSAGLVEAVLEGIERAKREEASWAQQKEDEQKEREEQDRMERERLQHQLKNMVVDASMTPVVAIDLWSRLGAGQTVSTKVARSSSLFGTTTTRSAPSVPQTQSKRATQSALFGTPRQPLASMPSATSFEALRQRIHGAISDAPRIPVPKAPAPQISQPPTSAEPTPTPAPPSNASPPKPASPPPATSKPVSTSADADEILTVAQPRSKSKKRKAPSQNDPSKKLRPDVQEFDFASAPNILDQGGDEDVGSSKKREKEKKKVASVYGNFPAPPKAQSEQRGGNRSHTFK